MNLSLAEIADLVHGRLAGDPAARATGVASLTAAGPGDVAFARKDTLSQAAGFKGACLLAPESVPGVANQILVADPQLAFAAVLRIVETERRSLPSGVHPSATVAATAQLAAGVAIGPSATVGEYAVIGENTAICAGAHIGDHVHIGPGGLVYPGVVIRERVTIGRNVIIHPNTTIGGDGFGFVPSHGRQVKMPQVGAVRIGDDVEIGCNCTIDRGAIEDTVIENGVKTDNHCHVAHNCRIGENTILVAYTRIGGSTVIGKNCILAEDAAVTDHVTIGDNSIVTATARVSKSWPAGSVLGGSPAMPFDEAKRVVMAQTRVPKALREITDLREKVNKILQHLGLA